MNKTLIEMINCIDDLLPQHTLSCVSQPDPQTTPWTFHVDSEGKSIVTFDSCQCPGRIKQIRSLLSLHKKSIKGFHK